jgi:hypothetical protein
LELTEGGSVGGSDRVEGMCASRSVLGADERAFEVEPGDLGAIGEAFWEGGEGCKMGFE